MPITANPRLGSPTPVNSPKPRMLASKLPSIAPAQASQRLPRNSPLCGRGSIQRSRLAAITPSRSQAMIP